MTDIPMVDLKAQFAAIREDVERNIDRVLAGTRFILGEEVEEFERAFAAYCGCRRAVGVASGLDAIKLTLRALGIGSGDEVVTAANTFIATTLAASSIGARPVLVDMDPESFNLDVRRLPEAITPRTRVLMPVHLYGRPAEMDPILDLARRHDLIVLEDASQAHGARYSGRRVGGIGHVAAFSLYPAKNLGAYGDAGVVTTNDEDLADRIAVLRNYGSKHKYHHEVLGENSRLDTIQAAVLNAKLPHLDAWNEARRAVAARYDRDLRGVGDLVLPETVPHVEHAFHQYVVRTGRRAELMRHLEGRGIACLVHYPVPIHLQEAYADAGWREGDFPVSERAAREILSLPIYPEMTAEQIGRVAAAVREFFGAQS